MRTGLCFLAVAVSAVAQTAVTAVGQIVNTPWVSSGGISFQSVIGHPYSADQVTERVQTLADGMCITQTMQTTKFYRDSAGRTRTEHVFTPPPGAVMAVGPNFIQIADPVAGYRYMLDPRTQTARRSAFAPAMQRPNMVAAAKPALPANAAATAATRPDRSRESLGTQTIEGVLAEGTRTTTTFPEGSMGNDRPITTVTEIWMSPDLKTMVLSKSSDPRYGDSTTKLTNIVTAEPDPALFQVPAEYPIVDEPAPVVR